MFSVLEGSSRFLPGRDGRASAASPSAEAPHTPVRRWEALGGKGAVPRVLWPQKTARAYKCKRDFSGGIFIDPGPI